MLTTLLERADAQMHVLSNRPHQGSGDVSEANLNLLDNKIPML